MIFDYDLIQFNYFNYLYKLQSRILEMESLFTMCIIDILLEKIMFENVKGWG